MGTGCGSPAEITIVNRRHPLGSALCRDRQHRDRPLRTRDGHLPVAGLSNLARVAALHLAARWRRASDLAGLRPARRDVPRRVQRGRGQLLGWLGPNPCAQIRRPTSPTRSAAAGSLDPGRGAGPRVRSSFPAPRAVVPDLRRCLISPTLPPDLSRFIGRARELREITVLVAPGRLVTLLGPDECGKTRLAAPAVI